MKPKKRELHEMPFTKTVKSCLKLRPVLVDLELAPLTLIKLKDDMVQLQPFANWNILQYVVQSRRCETLELEIFYFHDR